MLKKSLPFLILGLMIGLFLFSAQESGETNSVSFGVCSVAAKILYKQFAFYDADVQEILVQGLNPFIRKAAHFGLYALLGALCYLWLRRMPHNITTSMSVCALFASLDEFHQLFVPGRTGKVTDIFLDCFGSACGIAAAFLLLCLLYCLKHKNVVERGSWKE